MSVSGKLARGAATTLGASFASIAFSVLTTFVLLRFLSVPEFGTYALSLSFIAVATMFVDLGIRNLVIADAAQELGRKRLDSAKEILKSYLKFESRAVLLELPLVLAAAYLVMSSISATQPLLLAAIVAAGVALTAGVNLYAAVFYSFQSFGSYARLQVASSILEFIFILSLTRGLNLGVVGALAGYLLGMLASLIVTLPALARIQGQLKSVKTPYTGLFRQMLRRHGKFSIAAALTKPLADYAPFWILQAVSGLTAVGIYGAAFRIFQFMLVFPVTMENVLLPALSSLYHESRSKMERVYTRAVKYNMALSAILAVAAFIAAEPLVNLLFPNYSSSVRVFDIMLVALLLYGAASGQRSIFFAFKAQKQFFYSFLFTLAATLAVGVPAALQYGAVGMSLTFVGVLAAATALRSYYIRRLDGNLRIRPKELFTIDETDRKLLARALRKIKREPTAPE